MNSEVVKEEKHVNEFERTPVPKKSWLGFKSFLGMYAGEHCAGTELMIGPLFVAAGVSAFDLVFGLLIGNFLAVLSWRFITAPVATKARLTLYYQLEKICGKRLVTIYNIANGVMFCFLAGAMITVSATAVGVWFNFPMPTLNTYLPNSIEWCIVVIIIGAVISFVAAAGYKKLADFANIAAPWMVLVFVAFAIVMLKKFIVSTGAHVHSLDDLWILAKTVIWKGGPPLIGQVKFTFWHVLFFAWGANMAMHIGMSDLSVLRYAKHPKYAYASGAGMYVGHFMAWIAASLLYAYQLHLDPSNTNVLPGPMAYNAAGVAGVICVILAGWTTANPTIYRAGLAFQAICPNRSRFAVTIFTGGLATLAGIFPAIAMKLLNFVALYGLLLMPMGAVIIIDFYLMKKLKLESNYAEKSGLIFNWAACFAWIGTLIICLSLVWFTGLQIYFVSLPGWFIAAFIYIVMSKLFQNPIVGEATT